MVTPDGPVRMEAIMKSARSPLCVEISTWAHEPHFISSKASLLCYTGIDREMNIWEKIVPVLLHFVMVSLFTIISILLLPASALVAI